MAWLSPKSVAKHLDIGVTSVYRLVDEGRLPAPHYITPSMPRWHEAEIDGFIKGDTAGETFADALKRLKENRQKDARGRKR